MFFFALACLVASGFGSDVVELSDANFKKLVLGSDLPFLVEFFAPWCGHCQRLAPEWEKAATNLKGIMPVGKVDCTVHQSLCGQYQVQGYPTIKLFSDKGKKVEDYQQARQAASIVRYATDSLPNLVQRVADTTALSKFLEANPSQPHVLIFSTKTEVSSILKSLAINFKGRVAFGQVPQSAAAIVEQYSVTSFPKVIVVTSDQERHEFAGTINGEQLKSFIGGFAGEASGAEAVPPPPPASKPKPKAVEQSYVEVTSDNIDTVCPSLCVLGFVDVEGTESEKTINADQKKVLDEVLSSFQKDGKFKFGYVDKSNAQLTSKFSLSNEPSLIVFNGKRQRYIKSENFEFKTIFSTLEHVLTGDAHYTNL
uniref:Thioredoxin domain-containing protein n=1 Tax=Arcella intermedia TaxID=1963864 RepID=A0A6B2L798_9EUKA